MSYFIQIFGQADIQKYILGHIQVKDFRNAGLICNIYENKARAYF